MVEICENRETFCLSEPVKILTSENLAPISRSSIVGSESEQIFVNYSWAGDYFKIRISPVNFWKMFYPPPPPPFYFILLS